MVPTSGLAVTSVGGASSARSINNNNNKYYTCTESLAAAGGTNSSMLPPLPPAPSARPVSIIRSTAEMSCVDLTTEDTSPALSQQVSPSVLSVSAESEHTCQRALSPINVNGQIYGTVAPSLYCTSPRLAGGSSRSQAPLPSARWGGPLALDEYGVMQALLPSAPTIIDDERYFSTVEPLTTTEPLHTTDHHPCPARVPTPPSSALSPVASCTSPANS